MRRLKYLVVCLLLVLPLTAGHGVVGGAPLPEHSGADPEAWPREPLGPPGESPSNTWHVEAVDAPRTFYWPGPRSLALDSAGHPHVAYEGDHLYYAWYDGASWHTEAVDSGGGMGALPALALDGEGYPHISYCLFDPYADHCDDLRYAHWDGTSWQIETVDSAGYVGRFSSLALDASDRPCISYLDEDNGFLKYARLGSAGWEIETVDSDDVWGGVDGTTSLALDADGHPHISYCYFDLSQWWCDNLKYAHWDGASWQIETVESAGAVGQGNSLALDAAGHPHISYLEDYGQDLKYAAFDGTAW